MIFQIVGRVVDFSSSLVENFSAGGAEASRVCSCFLCPLQAYPRRNQAIVGRSKASQSRNPTLKERANNTLPAFRFVPQVRSIVKPAACPSEDAEASTLQTSKYGFPFPIRIRREVYWPAHGALSDQIGAHAGYTSQEPFERGDFPVCRGVLCQGQRARESRMVLREN